MTTLRLASPGFIRAGHGYGRSHGSAGRGPVGPRRGVASDAPRRLSRSRPLCRSPHWHSNESGSVVLSFRSDFEFARANDQAPADV
ncbi:hypothetical protein LAUMK41_04166 [Mycobacterium attenuatum]|nr:hypothetical protein LAUMK41_04166 [Mycobacterium attenuatum]